MLQKLEKEIDDVDAKIGDRWRLLDRYVCTETLIIWTTNCTQGTIQKSTKRQF